MAMLSIFRGLIFAALAFLAVLLIATWAGPDYPEEVTAFLTRENQGTLSVMLDAGSRGSQLAVGLLLLAYLGGYFAALLGMLTYRRWARVLFIVLLPVAFVLQGAVGTTIYTPLESVMEMTTHMINGALLVLLFVDPVRARFREPALPPGTAPMETPPPPPEI